MTAFRAALLDLDGTLLDSIPDLAFAANAMRVELGMSPLREDVVATFVGKGVDNLVRRSLAGSLEARIPSPPSSTGPARPSSGTTTWSTARRRRSTPA